MMTIEVFSICLRKLSNPCIYRWAGVYDLFWGFEPIPKPSQTSEPDPTWPWTNGAFLESGTLTPPPAHYLLEMGLKEGGVSEMVVKGGEGSGGEMGWSPMVGGRRLAEGAPLKITLKPLWKSMTQISKLTTFHLAKTHISELEIFDSPKPKYKSWKAISPKTTFESS